MRLKRLAAMLAIGFAAISCHGKSWAQGEPALNKLQEWNLPTKWSMPYQAKVDRNGDVWAGGMAADRIARINSRTGEITEYPLPANTNIRNLYVDDSTTPISIWFGNNHGAAIVKLEPLD